MPGSRGRAPWWDVLLAWGLRGLVLALLLVLGLPQPWGWLAAGATLFAVCVTVGLSLRRDRKRG